VLQTHFQTDMIFGRCAGGVVATFFGEAVRVFPGALKILPMEIRMVVTLEKFKVD
jgi:hypothetical protein